MDGRPQTTEEKRAAIRNFAVILTAIADNAPGGDIDVAIDEMEMHATEQFMAIMDRTLKTVEAGWSDEERAIANIIRHFRGCGR